MAFIFLSDPIEFPIGAVRALLREFQPHFRWQCGDLDEGRATDRASFDRPHLITGRSDSGLIMVNVSLEYARLEGAEWPRHGVHIRISDPTTDDDHIANRVRIIIGAALANFAAELCVGVQLQDGDDLLDLVGLRAAMALVADGVPLDECDPPVVDLLQTCPDAIAAEPDAPLTSQTAAAHAVQLLPLILLLNGGVMLDWGTIGRQIKELDLPGSWEVRCEANGHGFLMGRSGTIGLMNPVAPLAQKQLNDALVRSPAASKNWQAITTHNSQLIISATIEDGADFAGVQGVVRVMSLIAAVAAHDACVVAILNANTGILHEPGDIADMQPAIAQGDIPLALWTHCQWHSTVDNNVSLSTTGFAPLLGYEIEVWNAPSAVALVQEKMSFLLRYLVDNGPVIGDGDICGVTAGDRAIRCFHRESRAVRAEPVPAMIVEFDLPLFDTAARPRPAVVPKSAEPPTNPPPRIARSFGRKGIQ